MKVCVILTCFNRKNKTINCIHSLVSQNPDIQFEFIITDDNSSDGTAEALKELPYRIMVLHGDGKLFWCGGMRVGISEYLKSHVGTECLLINDDVVFFDHTIEKMVEQAQEYENVVIVGATCDTKGNMTYGLRKHKNRKSIELESIEPNDDGIVGETMNANCVLIPYEILKSVGNFDPIYRHAYGDYDMGFQIRKKGYKLISSNCYVGICETNSFDNTWRDKKLPRMERLRKKESPKGTPCKEWFHFLYKNYGILFAVKYSLTPYIKILIGQ